MQHFTIPCDPQQILELADKYAGVSEALAIAGNSTYLKDRVPETKKRYNEARAALVQALGIKE